MVILVVWYSECGVGHVTGGVFGSAFVFSGVFCGVFGCLSAIDVLVWLLISSEL